MTVVLFTVLHANAGSAMAMVCEGPEAEDLEVAMSSQLSPITATPRLAKVLENTPRPQACEYFGDIDCTMSHPDGEPRLPRPFDPQRSVAATVNATIPEGAPVGCRLLASQELGQTRPGHAQDIFRPPRRS